MGPDMKFDLATAVQQPHRIRHRNSPPLRFTKVVPVPNLDTVLVQTSTLADLLLPFEHAENPITGPWLPCGKEVAP